jgi:hypothetical protein
MGARLRRTGDVTVGLASSLQRIFPRLCAAGIPSPEGVTLPRGGIGSFQAWVRNEGIEAIEVSAHAEAPNGIEAGVRSVGLVPMAHHNTDTPTDQLDGVGHLPGLVPDPLLPTHALTVGPMETRAFWISLRAEAHALIGEHAVPVRLRIGETCELRIDAPLQVAPIEAAPLDGFPVTHWFYADALCDRYGTRPYGPSFWPIAERYMANHAAHGGTCQYVPIFTPPTDGVKRPTQLLRVRRGPDGVYAFDFRDVRRWLRTARRCGARFFEWTHLFTQWGVEHAIRVYETNADEGSLLWPPETGATSPTYRAFLGRFLPAFHAFLQEERALDCSFFHVSDEPSDRHLANYRAARDMLRELAPWMKVADALSHVEFGQLGLTDVPIAGIASAAAYREAGIPAWAYFCCGPRGRFLNRLMDTPLGKMRMAGRLLHALGAQGFLHWGYNYWYRSQTRDLVDPFTEQAGGVWPGWPYGDPFVVYPGADGPIDSIRWEIWAEAMQELALLRQLGIGADDPLLAGFHAYDDFPWPNPAAEPVEAATPVAAPDPARWVASRA